MLSKTYEGISFYGNEIAIEFIHLLHDMLDVCGIQVCQD